MTNDSYNHIKQMKFCIQNARIMKNFWHFLTFQNTNSMQHHFQDIDKYFKAIKFWNVKIYQISITTIYVRGIVDSIANMPGALISWSKTFLSRRSFYHEYPEVIQRGMPFPSASTFYMYPFWSAWRAAKTDFAGSLAVDLFAVAPYTVLTTHRAIFILGGSRNGRGNRGRKDRHSSLG